MNDDFNVLLAKVAAHLAERDATLDTLPVTPSAEAVHAAVAALPHVLPEAGMGTGPTLDYLLSSVIPGCLTAQNGPRYFGFVTGGVTPAAQLADILGSGYDENVQVTLGDTSAATAVEARALEMVLDLLEIPRETYAGRTVTTGATASNVLGLACAREALCRSSPHTPPNYSYAASGPPPGMTSPPIVVLGLHPHWSIKKAAALVGLGNGPSVFHSLPADPEDELEIDLSALRGRLLAERSIGRGVIVTYGLGEVNTGGFGRGLPKVAELCRHYGAWLHVDAAFGGFAGAVPELRHLVDGMDMADSLTLDGHKWLNVPYDCGLFFTRDAHALPSFLGPSAANTPAYLAAAEAAIPSPLTVNIENSRRFRALPLFASLLSLGKDGYADIVRRNVAFARRVAAHIASHPSYELLNQSPEWLVNDEPVPLNIVLFRGAPGSRFDPTAADAHSRLTAAINDTRRMYVSGTQWAGNGAVRLAVSNWRTGDDDFRVVCAVLDEVMA
ncbi:hypothetical protein CcaverHIS002_0208760 [Cutaneotrichosporon cavernicola]|uniref:PLP-dependent transferase n=1 Tax=Cutaneotrichosporon cavernicola TaxID=279322 RepID=A0AA48I7Z4_9TREE|nr:uncharacterized protein CcaverHIS019_0208770 [Cutaneotrichosporon cavernicola]BEI81716.1 hypothetical protein CcaverHIS002_0208760 [Cutaneotrichosporon cavernicola]BEI89515.1 hypothetical protein CcaverHIS019_0208770 [Cutaneotrichosporon cavernicola]BEI97288.1 hypothetical protein CcaverHIS631_0208770 [Cutaneotrichosporon cavernicola]BEJ05062.1 hypothetical protein CcaverHIS641_0208790 [Cutaneotrichosporon cavernicola]